MQRQAARVKDVATLRKLPQAYTIGALQARQNGLDDYSLIIKIYFNVPNFVQFNMRSPLLEEKKIDLR